MVGSSKEKESSIHCPPDVLGLGKGRDLLDFVGEDIQL